MSAHPMPCSEQITEALALLDAPAGSFEGYVALLNQALGVLNKLAPDCGPALATHTQDYLALLPTGTSTREVEWPFKLLLRALSRVDAPATLALASAALEALVVKDVEWIVDILDHMADVRTVPLLWLALRADRSEGDGAGEARYKAIRTLAALPQPEPEPRLLAYLHDPVDKVRRAAIQYALDADMREAIPSFVAQVESEDDPDNLTRLVSGLAQWQHTAALPLLRDLLTQPWATNDEDVYEALTHAVQVLETASGSSS